MSAVQDQIERARKRLWLEVFLEVGCRTVTWAGVALAVSVLVSRLFSWTFPWLYVLSGFCVAVVAVSVVWSVRVRPARAAAAAVLDDAVGLRERVSSSLYCASSDDPFARAVLADAEHRVASVTVRRHLRLRWPRSAPKAAGAVLLAAVMFLVPDGLLSRAEARTEARKQVELSKTRVAIKKRLEAVKKMAETNPALTDLKAELEKLDQLSMEKMDKPSDIRQEALKKIDKLTDAVRKKQKSDKFNSVTETKKMLRAIQQPAGEKTPVQKLAQQLKTGDFKSAQETIKAMQEQLATLKKDSDKEFVQKMQKQLEQLAKQMDKIADQKQLKQKLEQAGIKKEDVERMLERLSKEDLDQIRKQLEKNGMSQKQIEKTLQQCKKQQGASQAMQQMSKAMKSAAQAAGDGDMGSAAGSLESAGEQLSELEMLEQEMNQLDSALSSLQDAKSGCNGQGDKPGQGQGKGDQDKGGQGGMGKLGQGRGGRASSEETAVGFKVERGKVETTKGKIIGQFLVDGEQIKGEASDGFVELIEAGQREATDTVNRDRIPRQYHKSLKEYFSRLPAEFGIKIGENADADPKSGTDEPGEAEPTDSTNTDAPAGDSGD